MKKSISFFMYLLLASSIADAAISFESREFRPTGKHFTTQYNLVYHFYSPLATEKVILLHYKTASGVYVYKGIEVSQSLEAKLPKLVITYIGLQIADIKMKQTHSVSEVKEAVRQAVEKALDQKYKNSLLTQGAVLAADSSYFRGHCNTKWWTPNYYYDFEPVFSIDSTHAFLTNAIEDTKFPALTYVSDSLKNFNYHNDTKSLAKWGNVFQKVRNTPNTRTVRDWGFVRNIIANGTYHRRSDSCKFYLKKTDITHGERYPKFASVSIFGWHATYCNYFASDLRKEVFGNSLWATEGCKKDYGTVAANPDFVDIKKEEVFQYSNAGYFVFAIDEGHISTFYPNGEHAIQGEYKYPKKVVQAGEATGIRELFTVWSNFHSSSVIKCYIYLGYLKDNI